MLCMCTMYCANLKPRCVASEGFLGSRPVCVHVNVIPCSGNVYIISCPTHLTHCLGDTLSSNAAASPDSFQLCIDCLPVWRPWPFRIRSPLLLWSWDPRCDWAELLGLCFTMRLACTCKHLVPASQNVSHPFTFTSLYTIGSTPF